MKTPLASKTATALLLALLAGGVAAETPAEAPDCPPRMPMHHDKGHRLERLQTELGLSEAQKSQVQDVFRAHFEKHRAEMEARMKAMHAELRGELAKILTPEQLTKFDAMQARREQRREQWHKGQKAAE